MISGEMTGERVLTNRLYTDLVRFTRNFAVVYLVAAAAISLLYLAFFGEGGFVLLLIFVLMIPFIFFPPYSPKTVTLTEDEVILDYQRPLKDVTVTWTLLSVVRAVRKKKPFGISESCTLEFFGGSGNKIRPPLLLHISIGILDEIEEFLRKHHSGVIVRRDKTPWFLGGGGWGND